MLVAWATLEGAIAHYAGFEDQTQRWRNPREQLSNLYSLGYVSRDDFERLRRLWRLRSEIAHRASRVAPEDQDIEFVVSIVEHMATDQYVSVDEMAEWLLSSHGRIETTSLTPEGLLAKRFRSAPEKDIQAAASLVRGMEGHGRHADSDELVRRFTAEVNEGIETLTQLGYLPARFKQLVDQEGAVKAATRLILDPRPSYGLWRLQKLGRLDMSVEMWALLPWYEGLFGQTVRDHAERKLRLLDVDVDAELRRLIERNYRDSGK